MKTSTPRLLLVVAAILVAAGICLLAVQDWSILPVETPSAYTGLASVSVGGFLFIIGLFSSLK